MKIVAFLALVVCGCMADKERVDSHYADLLSDNLIQQIQKRLQKWDTDDSQSDALSNQSPASASQGDAVANAGKLSCHFTMEQDTIIRTKDSLDAGATYQSAPTVNSKEECRNECCKLGTKCNLAVFKEKV